MSSAPRDFRRIPNRLNTFLTLAIVSGLVGLLVLGARVESGWALGLCVAAFALLFQTQFALLHEASHLKLHSNPSWNRWLGVLSGLLFPISAVDVSITHWSHHLKNRSDQEMFDLYYPHQSRVGRTIGWYLMLVGFWYWIIPPFLLLLLVAPRVPPHVRAPPHRRGHLPPRDDQRRAHPRGAAAVRAGADGRVRAVWPVRGSAGALLHRGSGGLVRHQLPGALVRAA